jgi:predicted TIM-barrel fold metal-dependent hydrolase
LAPDEAIRRDYPISEYLADIAAAGVEKAVYVQANWPNEKAVEEVAWIERLALETGWPHASIAYADMTVRGYSPLS